MVYRDNRWVAVTNVLSSGSKTANVTQFGAKGDGGDDTAAINDALDWWVAEPYRHLHFPEGTYLYTGSKDLDFGHQSGNKLTMDGSIKATNTTGFVFVWRRLSDASIQMNVFEGGEAGTGDLAGNYRVATRPNGDNIPKD